MLSCWSGQRRRPDKKVVIVYKWCWEKACDLSLLLFHFFIKWSSFSNTALPFFPQRRGMTRNSQAKQIRSVYAFWHVPAREIQPERASQREPARESQLDRASQREPARESQPESDPHGRESQPESVHRGMPPDQDNQTACGQRHTVTLMHTPKWGRAGSGRKVPPVNKDVKENLSGVGTGSAIAAESTRSFNPWGAVFG